MTSSPLCLEQFDLPSLQGLESHLEKMERRAAQACLETDFEYFAGKHLRIRGKSGTIVPLVFNRAQRHIHERIEAQRAATGKVRALILKGRQQGCSSYVAARFYHRTRGPAACAPSSSPMRTRG